MSARDDEHGLHNCQGPCHQGNWQIKRVSSGTGPYTGTVLSDAIRRPHSVPGETKLLWRADSRAAGGWKEGHSYRFSLTHRPRLGLIRLQLWEGEKLIADSGHIIDDGPDSLRGGRLGVYCDSQEQITWAALSYRSLVSSVTCNDSHTDRCNDELAEDILQGLPALVREKYERQRERGRHIL